MDASAVNLRLQYSSYFLFVLVITCVLYGMIKGRPGKQGFIKKVGDEIIDLAFIVLLWSNFYLLIF